MMFKKFAKKTVAVIIAVAIMLCCITVSFSSFAETSSFSVTAGSPAIPLYVDKAIDLNTLPIKIGSYTVFADKLSWEKLSGNSVRIASGMLIGVTEGITEFKVGNGSVFYTVYVIVNKQGNNDFSIVNIDFNDETTFSQSDWYGIAAASYSSVSLYTSGYYFNKLDTCRKFKSVTTSDNVSRNAMYVGSISDLGGTKGAIFHNDMLENFGDYTIEAKMSHIMNKNSTSKSNMISAAGIMARVSLVSTAATENTNPLDANIKSLHFRMRNYGGLTVTAYSAAKSSSSDNYLANDVCYSYYNGSVSADDLWIGGKSDKVFMPDAYGTSKPTVRDIKLSLKGTDIAYSIDGNEILNTAKGNINSMFIPVNNSEGATSTNPSTTATSALKNTIYNGNYTAGPTISKSDYDGLYNQNLQAEKGTIGFTMNYGGDIYVYSVKVTPQNIVEAMPIMHDLSEDYSDGIPVNTRYDLSKDDADVVWNNVKTDNYEIKDGVITVYSKPENSTIIVTGNKNGQPVAIALDILDAGTETLRDTETFADSDMKITANPLAVNRFNLTIDDTDGKEVVHGSIKVTDGDTEFTVYNTAQSKKGNEFEFAVLNPDDFKISAEYTTKEKNKASVYNLGSTVRLGKGNEAIRYLTRIPAITKTPAGTDIAGDITVDEESVTPISVGTLLMPSIILGDDELKFPENYNGGSFVINGAAVQNSVIKTLSNATDKYSDAYTVIGGFKNAGFDFDPLDIDITAVSYICYEDENGNKGYIYSNPKTSNYNGVLQQAFPLKETDTDLSAAISGGTSHDLDPYDYTTNLSYGVGEDITFNYQIKGAYTIDWKLYKDNPADNVIEAIGEKCGEDAFAPVASGRTLPGDKYFTLTTRMNQTDMLSLVITVTDSYGNPVTYNDGQTAEFTQKAGAVDNVYTDKLVPANLGENVSFHTDLQKLFVTDREQALKTAKGKSELSKPLGITLSWQSTVKDVLNFSGYKVTLSEDKFFASAKEYTTNDTSLTLTNLKLGTTYYWKVAAMYNGKTYYSMPATFKTESTTPRNMNVSGLTNVRDLGGWATDDGKTVRQGLLYRCSRLSDDKQAALITPEGISTMLGEMGVKTEMDLRLSWQTGNMKTSPLGSTVNYYNIPMNADLPNIIEDNAASVIKAFEILGDESKYPIAFHCSIGTDRTGAIAFLVNALLGVSVEDLYNDYLFSNFGNIGDPRDTSVPDKYYNEIIKAQGETFKEKTYNYLVNLGVDSDDIDNMIKIMK